MRGRSTGQSHGAGVWGRHAGRHMGPACGAVTWGRHAGPAHGASSVRARVRTSDSSAQRSGRRGLPAQKTADATGWLSSPQHDRTSSTGPDPLGQARWVRPAGPADGQLRPPQRSLQGPPTSGHPLGGAPAPCPARTQWGRRSGSRAWRCLRRPSGRGAL